MTINEAIDTIDSLKHNTYTQEDKVGWLSRLDWKVKKLIIDTHEGADDVEFSGYTTETDINTELLVPAPFDEVYLRWIEMQIDYANGEYGRYNNSKTMFDDAYSAYERYYNRTHMPIGCKRKFH